jgi:hypothetical protein
MPRLAQVESEVAQLAVYEGPDDLAALREVRDELVEAGAIRAPPEAGLAAKAAAKGRKATKKDKQRSGGAAGAAGGQGFRRFESPGGFAILVGRNNKQNDVLSHQVANPQDLWMHVRGMPGSHTLLRVEPGRGAPGEEDVRAAAALAAWFSKARDSGKADVIVTRAGALPWGRTLRFVGREGQGCGRGRAGEGQRPGRCGLRLQAGASMLGPLHRRRPHSHVPPGVPATCMHPTPLPPGPVLYHPASEHVRKFKGAKPGQVILAKEDRVVVVRPQDSSAATAAVTTGGGGQ